VRYPADLRPKILIVVALFSNLLCAIAAVVSPGTFVYNCLAALLLVVTTALYLRLWPRTLVTDQTGLHAFWIFGLRRQFISWVDLGFVEEEFSLGMAWPARLGLRVDQLAVVSRDGLVRIAHTPIHPDRERMLKDFQLHGVNLDSAAADTVAPGA
jgi:hypothetical protein